MQRYGFIVIILLIALTTNAQDTITENILTQVNAARQNNGVSALVFNPQLQITAQQHSDDMASADILSHVSADGSQFWERMQQNGYTLSAGAENVLSRGDTNPNGAFQQWFNSEPHRINMLSADYVEVGIAYARADSGRFYFTMVLGNRADFVAPTAIPTNTPLPTNTPIPPTSAPTATRQLAPTNILPTSTPRPTSTPAPLPIVTNTPLPTATEFIAPDIRLVFDNDTITLINVSGTVLNLANLVFESDRGTMSASRWNTQFLSQPLSGFTDQDCLQAWTLDVNYLNKIDDCRYRHAWIAVADGDVFWHNTDLFTVRNGDNLVGACLVAEGTCDVNLSTVIDDITVLDPVTFGQLPDLRLEYPDSSFTLINIAGRDLDLTGLVFRSESGSLAVEDWDIGFLTQPLTDFETGGCLQAWTPDYINQPEPERCITRHAWILVDDSGDFWRQIENFTIERDGVLLGRCFSDTTTCNVSLSSDFGNIPQATPISAGNQQTTADTQSTFTNDIQLAITSESITLINTSDEALDISNMVFQSQNGTLSANRWQIPQLSTSLTAFPSGDCVQIWGVGTIEQAKPTSCSVRHAWVAALANEQFWINSSAFEVYNNGILIATCETRTETCNFDLR